jgi:hypothetical protein
MKLDAATKELLSGSRLGLLAITAGELPLVNPAAFHFGRGALWMTTSRHAAKVRLLRRDSRAAFLVTGPNRAAVLTGRLEEFDPLDLRSDVRAVFEGPGFAINLAGYAFKNARYVGGYLFDLLRTPMDWWPQNRVLLRLRVERVLRPLAPPAPDHPQGARLPFLPASVSRQVERTGAGYLCWIGSSGPVLTPALWAVDGDDLVAWTPGPEAPPLAGSASGALLVERHHPFRATRMVGACLRGRLSWDPAALAALAQRFGPGAAFRDGTCVRLRPERATSWQGFTVRTHAVRAEPAQVARTTVLK